MTWKVIELTNGRYFDGSQQGAKELRCAFTFADMPDALVRTAYHVECLRRGVPYDAFYYVRRVTAAIEEIK